MAHGLIRKLQYPTAGLDRWGGIVARQEAARAGLYEDAGATNNGGDIWIDRLPTRRYLLLRQNRTVSPYLGYQFSDDGEFFVADTAGMGGAPIQTNGFVALPRSNVVPSAVDELFILGNNFTGGSGQGNLMTARSTDWGYSHSGSATIALARAPNRAAIQLESGTWLIPVHYAVGGDDTCSVIRSTDGGFTWSLGPAVGLAGIDLNEPGIAEIDGRVLMVMRREDGSTAYPHYYSWLSDEGQTLDTAPAQITDIFPQTSAGSSPPVLLKLRDNRVLLGYAPDPGNVAGKVNNWMVYATRDGENWTLIKEMSATGAGATTSNRYMAMVEHHIHRGRVWVLGALPDFPLTALQFGHLWTTQPLTCQLPISSTVYVQRFDIPPFTNGVIYFDLYVTRTSTGAGSAAWISTADAAGSMASFEDLNNGQIHYRTAGSLIDSTKLFTNLREKRLRLVYDIDNNLISYYINDYTVAANVAPRTGWTQGRLPDRIRFNVPTGTTETFEVREFNVYKILS